MYDAWIIRGDRSIRVFSSLLSFFVRIGTRSKLMKEMGGFSGLTTSYTMMIVYKIYFSFSFFIVVCEIVS